jgi:hypothetical protein
MDKKSTIELNIEAIRAAAGNSKKLQDIVIEAPTVDPKDLSCDDQIFGIVLNPVNDKLKGKVTPDTTCYPAVQAVLIDTLSTRAKPGFLTVNGTIDLPKEGGGKLTKLENSYFASNEDAKSVCRTIAEENSDFLANLIAKDRF